MQPLSRLSRTPCWIGKSDTVKKLAGKSLLLIFPNNERMQVKLSIFAVSYQGDKWSVKVWTTWMEPEPQWKDINLGVSPPPAAQAKVWERYLDEQAILNIKPNDDDGTPDLLLFVSEDERDAQVLDMDRNLLSTGSAYFIKENSSGKFYQNLGEPQIETERVKFLRLLPSGTRVEISNFALIQVGPSAHYTFRTGIPPLEVALQ